MVSITIRNVPDDVRNELAARAARSGRSLQEFLVATLTEVASRPSLDEWLEEARRSARTLPPIDRAEVLRMLEEDRR